MAGELISQKKCAQKLNEIAFQLQCLDEARQTANEMAIAELSDYEDPEELIQPYISIMELEDQRRMIQLASEECGMLAVASDFVERLILERLRLGMLEDRLHHENAWLEQQNETLQKKVSDICARIDVEDSHTKRYLLFCQLRQATIERSNRNKLKFALFDKDLNLDKTILVGVSNPIKIILQRAIKRFNSGQIETTVSMCNKAQRTIKSGSLESVLISFLLGLCALRQGDVGDAVIRLGSAADDLSSKQVGWECLVPVLMNYAKALTLDGKHTAAIEQLQMIIQPGRARSIPCGVEWQVRTEITANQLKLGNISEALEILIPLVKEVTDLLPVNDSLLIRMKNYQARCYLCEGKINEAEDIIRPILCDICSHNHRMPLVDILHSSEQFEVHNGLELAQLYGTTSSIMELFTIQTLSNIYGAQETKSDTAALLDSYVQLNGIDFPIE